MDRITITFPKDTVKSKTKIIVSDKLSDGEPEPCIYNRIEYNHGKIEFHPLSYDSEIILATERYGAMIEEAYQKALKNTITPQQLRNKVLKKKFNFEYCECGCKGYVATYKNCTYAIFWDLETKDEQPFRAYDGHGCLGNFIGKASTYEEAEIIVQKHYDNL